MELQLSDAFCELDNRHMDLAGRTIIKGLHISNADGNKAVNKDALRSTLIVINKDALRSTPITDP